ncbi:MAG: XTP/dITP diphosphatase [Clostridiales bacterium]|nr:XTP/dITP diphosphatase [Clostridiales bacterium]
MNTFVLASKNKHKADEIKTILGGGFDVITQTEAGAGDISVVEDGTTFEENAVKKAETIMRATGKPTIADDSGLCVDFLGGAPGVYTARYAGEHATDQENIEKLMTALNGVTFDKRGARFVCVIAFSRPGEETVTFRGECDGFISLKPMGNGGFGYDPVFYVERYNKTMAELEPHIKNALSHRFSALKKFKEYLTD